MSEGRAVAVDRLRDMVEACRAIAGYAGRGRSTFDDDSAVRDAILYQLVVLGEAAKVVVRADAELAGELSTVEWSLLARLRDRLTHHYWATDREVVWSTVTRDVPELERVLNSALHRLT